MPTRRDLHSPSNFDPALYSYEGAFDAWRDYPAGIAQAQEENHLMTLLSERGFRGGNWEQKGQCDHCGARMRYVTVWHRSDVDEFIAVGLQCAEERFNLPDRITFDVRKLQARVQAEKERRERAARIAEKVQLMPEPLRTAMYPETDLTESLNLTDYALGVVTDIRDRFLRWENLSDKQAAFVVSLIEKANRPPAPAEIKVPAPTGRVPFEGVVISRKDRETDYGMVWKITVKVETPDGIYLVWVTEPSSIETERGDIVRMVATLTPSTNDPSFAFGKMPKKAEVLGQVEDIANLPSALD